jgi:hypothetical protein
MVKLVLKTSPKAEEIVIRLVKNDTTIETTNSDLLNLRSFSRNTKMIKHFIGIEKLQANGEQDKLLKKH